MPALRKMLLKVRKVWFCICLMRAYARGPSRSWGGGDQRAKLSPSHKPTPP